MIGNKCRRFSIAEFVLIIGLICVGDLYKNRLTTGDDSFRKYYFKDYSKLSKADLETVFFMSQFRNNDEAVSMAVLYLIDNFLFV